MKNILITGAAGFIGRNFFAKIERECFNVVGIDDLSVKPTVKPDRRLVIKSVENLSLSDLKDIDIVVHLAAKKSVPESFLTERLMLDNIQIAHHLLNLAINSTIKRLFLASSCEVYGDRKGEKLSETTPFAPRSPYAVAKTSIEYLADLYRHLNPSIQITTLRFFNIYGPDENIDAAIPRFIYDMTKSGVIYVEGDGTQSRDFTYISDAVEVVSRIVQSKQYFKTINVGSGQAVQIIDIANKVCKMFSNGQIEHVEPRLNEISSFVADNQLIRNHFGYRPKVPLDRGLWYCRKFMAQMDSTHIFNPFTKVGRSLPISGSLAKLGS